MVDLAPVTDQQKQLAANALQEFDGKQFTSCCNIMNKLMVLRGNDPRVVHNKAVADFCLSGLQSTDDFRHSLANVCSMAKVNFDSGKSLEDTDHSVLFYNQAIIFYHLRQYKAALNILEKLFQYIDPFSESLTKRVFLLQVELFLCTYQPEKAMGLLTYLEKNVFSGKNSGSNKSEFQRDDAGETFTDGWRPMLSLFKTRCLIMMKSMKACKREIKSLLNDKSANMSVVFLKANFEYLRGNYRKALKMLGSGPPMYTDKGECLTVMHFNNLGCLYFHLRKHHLGAFNFRKAILENENLVKEMRRSTDQQSRHNEDAHSGLAVHVTKVGAQASDVHQQSIHPSEADGWTLVTTNFHKLLSNHGAHNRLSGKPLHSLGMSRHYELMYNMGVQLLHCGKALPAFECLIEAVQMYQINPHLWLRLAECCIMACRENNGDDRKLSKRMEVIQGSVGSGVHRKLILGPGINQDKNSVGTPAIPAATLEFASLCLRNALLLLPDLTESTPDSSQSDDKEEGKVSGETVLVQAPPGNPLRTSQVENLRCSVLCASSYVALCLNDYTMALQHAEILLKQPKISGAQTFLAHLYMGEAQVALDHIADGIQHLNPELITDISTMVPDSKTEQDKNDKNDKGDKDADSPDAKGAFYDWSPKDLTTAKAIMQYNLAAAHAVRGEYDKAGFNLGESSKYIGTPLPAQMYFLKLYLDLIEGRRKMAQIVIKEHFGHVTPNRIDVKMEMKMAAKTGGNNSGNWTSD